VDDKHGVARNSGQMVGRRGAVWLTVEWRVEVRADQGSRLVNVLRSIWRARIVATSTSTRITRVLDVNEGTPAQTMMPGSPTGMRTSVRR
jgi:hypothetical protein